MHAFPSAHVPLDYKLLKSNMSSPSIWHMTKFTLMKLHAITQKQLYGKSSGSSKT